MHLFELLGICPLSFQPCCMIFLQIAIERREVKLVESTFMCLKSQGQIHVVLIG